MLHQLLQWARLVQESKTRQWEGLPHSCPPRAARARVFNVTGKGLANKQEPVLQPKELGELRQPQALFRCEQAWTSSISLPVQRFEAQSLRFGTWTPDCHCSLGPAGSVLRGTTETYGHNLERQTLTADGTVWPRAAKAATSIRNANRMVRAEMLLMLSRESTNVVAACDDWWGPTSYNDSETAASRHGLEPDVGGSASQAPPWAWCGTSIHPRAAPYMSLSRV